MMMVHLQCIFGGDELGRVDRCICFEDIMLCLLLFEGRQLLTTPAAMAMLMDDLFVDGDYYLMVIII